MTSVDLPDKHLSAQTQRSILQLTARSRPEERTRIWQQVVSELRRNAATPGSYRYLWEQIFAGWSHQTSLPAPIWTPSEETRQRANVTQWMQQLQLGSYGEFHRWSCAHREEFWRQAIDRLGIVFSRPPSVTLKCVDDATRAQWLCGARMNIVDSCFQAELDRPAVIWQRPGQAMQHWSLAQLKGLVDRVAFSLANAGLQPGDRIAVVLPMTALSVALYLGIVQAGCAVVSIADSFAAPEIASRMRISGAKAVVTYDVIQRGGKTIPLYQRVAQATERTAIVLSADQVLQVPLRSQDVGWDDFFADGDFAAHQADPDECINVLFSSGTTGDPKAIPWNHLTPLRCAIDAHVHQDVHPGQVLVWPTNLGWMMGPWLIFAALINRATIGLFEDVPTGAGFGQFVQDAGVNMLGVVPTIVKSWRASRCMEPFDWSHIRVFSSTGESSQAEDYFYLSSLAGMRPIIEYCGGTEIGGGYITSTVVQPNVPAAFSTPAAGLDFVILDQQEQPADDGELYLIPPSIGLSDTLLNRDHFETYYAHTPKGPDGQTLRRHGDHFRRLDGGYYVAGGRVDDTMNLGGIKISSAEIERVLNQIETVRETAAVAVAAHGGPEQLEVFVVTHQPAEAADLRQLMNERLKSQLNPLFKVHRVHFIASLPRTASNKVMRRQLRDQLLDSGTSSAPAR